MDRLIKVAHEKGLKVIIDIALNHTSVEVSMAENVRIGISVGQLTTTCCSMNGFKRLEQIGVILTDPSATGISGNPDD